MKNKFLPRKIERAISICPYKEIKLLVGDNYYYRIIGIGAEGYWSDWNKMDDFLIGVNAMVDNKEYYREYFDEE